MDGKQHIVLIRHAVASRKTAKNLLARSYKSIIMPFSQIKQISTSLPNNSFTGIIFTSPVAPRLIGDNLKCAKLKNLPVHCVGNATANSAKHSGFDNITTISADALTLANELIALKNEEKLLYPCAKNLSFDFVEHMKNNKASKPRMCIEWQIYDNLLITPTEEEINVVFAEARTVFLFSNRTSAHFFAVLDSKPNDPIFETCNFIAISQNVADTIPRKFLRKTYIADEKNEKSMIECLDKIHC